MTHSRRDASEDCSAPARRRRHRRGRAGSRAGIVRARRRGISACRRCASAKGPFLAAQKLDEAYLLRLEPDRMLHNFRVNAGLAPKAPVYGGWESVEPGSRSAVTATRSATTSRPRRACTRPRATRASPSASTTSSRSSRSARQRPAAGSPPFPDGVAPLTDSLAGKQFAGVPWYTTHKVFAGPARCAPASRQQAGARGLVTFADWVDAACADVPEDRFQKMLDREHGGMNEVFADLFGAHRRGALSAAGAALFAPRDARSPGAGRSTSSTACTRTRRSRKSSASAASTTSAVPTPSYDRAAKFFWQTVVEQRSFATGGHGDVEHFFPEGRVREAPGLRRKPWRPAARTTCCGSRVRCTRAIRRSPISTTSSARCSTASSPRRIPTTGMNTYFQATRPGYVRLYHTPFDSFWCCTGSGIENHARYGETIYAHDARHAVRQPVPRLHARLARARHHAHAGHALSRTPTPRASTSRPAKPQTLKLAIRQPGWCAAMTVTVNGKRKQS